MMAVADTAVVMMAADLMITVAMTVVAMMVVDPVTTAAMTVVVLAIAGAMMAAVLRGTAAIVAMVTAMAAGLKVGGTAQLMQPLPIAVGAMALPLPSSLSCLRTTAGAIAAIVASQVLAAIAVSAAIEL
jgi:hypothetical protein